MIRAHIRENFLGMFLEIALIQETDGIPSRILRIEDPGPGTVYRWEDLPDQPATDIAPTLQLGDTEARALLEALARHYDGASDVRALRRDYDHERKRVDDLTSAVVNVAHRLAEPTPAEATQHHVHMLGLSPEMEPEVRAALARTMGSR